MKTYQVVKQFDSSKDYGISIRPQFAKCLGVMKKGETINSKEFSKKHKNEFTTRRNTEEANLAVVEHTVSLGKKLGILKEIPNESKPILFTDFCNLDTVSNFRDQLRGSNRTNTKSNTNGTRDTYTRHLHYFNNWIHGKTLEYTKEVSSGKDTYKKVKRKEKLDGVEHFFQIYSESYYDKKPFVKMIKAYFLDSNGQSKSNAVRTNAFFAINEYFKKNDEPIGLSFDPNAGSQLKNDNSEPIMTLDEFLKLLTVGRPSITEKAVLLCKFQRGLDSSTLVDKFNFEAWFQLVDAFGTADFASWDLKKCPIQINLRRMKTNVSHSGFLDRDAISALVDYLHYRKKITGGDITLTRDTDDLTDDNAIFLNNFQKPISELWITQSFSRMRKNSGLDVIINKKHVASGGRKKYKITPHETRDLLKSILIESGVRYDLAEEFIGHKTGDSYEKQTRLFTKTLRIEYIKASSKINIFSKFQDFAKGAETSEEIQKKIKEMDEQMKKMEKRISRTDKLRKKR